MLALLALLGWMISRCSFMTKLMMARVRLRYVLPLAGMLLVTSVHAAGPSKPATEPTPFSSAMTGRQLLAACEGEGHADAMMSKVFQLILCVWSTSAG
jgi:hypothetical protein